MKTRAEFLGHPIHQMMIVLPLGLLATAAICDVISASRNRRLARGAYYMQSAGLLTWLRAAVPGAIDWWDIPQNKALKAAIGQMREDYEDLETIRMTPQHDPELKR